MTQDIIHRDLCKNLRNKLSLALQDHIELCGAVDIPTPEIAAGIGDILMVVTVRYFEVLQLTPQQFGQICYDSFEEYQQEHKARSLKRGGG